MDGENTGKNPIKTNDLGVYTPIFGLTDIDSIFDQRTSGGSSGGSPITLQPAVGHLGGHIEGLLQQHGLNVVTIASRANLFFQKKKR